MIFNSGFRSQVLRGLAAIQQTLAQMQQKEQRDMTALDDAISTVNTEISKMGTAVTAAVSDIAGLQKQIADLQTQLNSGAPVTQAQIDALNAASASLDTIANNLNAAVTPSAPPTP